MSPRWRKVLADLLHNPLRTGLVVLSIAVGLFALGTMVGMRDTLERRMSDAYAASSPAGAVLSTELFDAPLAERVRAMEQVEEVAVRRQVTAWLKVGEQWRTILLYAVPDFQVMTVDRVDTVNGAWPPPPGEVVLERSVLEPEVRDRYGSPSLGFALQIRLPDGAERALRVAGTAHDLSLTPAFFAGKAYGFISTETLELLGQPAGFNELHMSLKATDQASAERLANQVRREVESQGVMVRIMKVPEPGRHPLDFALQTVSLLLTLLAALALALSLLLTLNTLNAIMGQQVRQLGIMKALGASTGQLLRLYLALSAGYGLLAIALAAPAIILATPRLIAYAARLFNLAGPAFPVLWRGLLLAGVVGLMAPLLGAVLPVWQGVRITALEAMRGQGPAVLRRGWIDRVLERVRSLPRPLLLSLRSTFQRKGRLGLTLLTLMVGGATFVGVLSLRSSVDQTLARAFDVFHFDVELGFYQSYPADALVEEALTVPGVAHAEAWGVGLARVIQPDGREGVSLPLWAPPATTAMIRPQLLEGRWLEPSDTDALVFDTNALREYPHVRVGDEIDLRIRGKETRWQVVGIVKGELRDPFLFVNQPAMAQALGEPGSANHLAIGTAQQDVAFQADVARKLVNQFLAQGRLVDFAQSNGDFRSQLESQFSILVVLLLAMALLVAVVGGFGLAGTMGLNVLERFRELGVMRATGASHGAIFLIVLAEGILIGLLSWLGGSSLGFPLSRLLSQSVGTVFLKNPFAFAFSWRGVMAWLGISMIIAAAASFWPALRAARVPVRDVLQHE